MVGWDLAFPEVARSLAMEGAELLCVLANWETSQMEEYRTYLRSRAYENAIFVAASNRVGEDVTLNFGGESMVVGPRGKIHTTLAEEEKKDDEKSGEDEKKEKKDEKEKKAVEGFAVTRIDLDQVRKFREEFQLIQSRQPTSYKTIVKRY
jgi:predicted amidohydrolase